MRKETSRGQGGSSDVARTIDGVTLAGIPAQGAKVGKIAVAEQECVGGMVARYVEKTGEFAAAVQPRYLKSRSIDLRQVRHRGGKPGGTGLRLRGRGHEQGQAHQYCGDGRIFSHNFHFSFCFLSEKLTLGISVKLKSI